MGLIFIQKGLNPNIIFSGAAVNPPYEEAKIMAKYAKQMGIPAEHFL
jgi:hypothetical protein